MGTSELSAAKKKLGTRIRTLRQQKGLTRVALARTSGIRNTYLIKIERGNHDLRLGKLRDIARTVGTTMSQLLDGIL